jgi:hypothetical protein
MSRYVGRGARSLRRLWLVGVVVLPFVVAAIALAVRDVDYRPISDYALTEMQVRDLGHHEVLNGLYSREDWRHPGPLFFYVLAPGYWLSGHASISMFFTALGINAAAVVGIAGIAWRRGGTPMLLSALLACALGMRTLGTEFLYDPWNNYVVTLPFGLMLFATWALLCGERWALPVAVVVASFLAQTHVGFVLLTLPLLALGATALVVPILRRGTEPARRRSVLLALGMSAVLFLILWAAPAVDALTNDRSNLDRVVDYFGSSADPPQTVRTGWRIATGQFAWPPEWLVEKRTDLPGFGESPFKYESSVPWLLVPVVLAAAYQWWRRRDDVAGARWLAVVLAVAVGLAIVGVTRTLGPALDYRLRWTWMLGLAGFVLVAHTVWQLIARSSRRVERVLAVTVTAFVLVVTTINVVAAVRADPPWDADSEIVAAVTPPLLAELDPDGGQVVVTDRFSDAAWYARGIALQLERAGIDARVPAERAVLFGNHRVVERGEPVQAELLVVRGPNIASELRDPELRLVARWRPDPDSAYAADLRRRARLDRRLQAGELTPIDHAALVRDTIPGPPQNPITDELAVFASAATPRASDGDGHP